MEHLGSESAAASEPAEPAAADPVARSLLTTRTLTHVGTGAATVASILGGIALVAPGLLPGSGDDGNSIRERVAEFPGGKEVVLGIPEDGGVERMTYGRWIELTGNGRAEDVPPAERNMTGVKVDYIARFPGFALGTRSRVRFTLKDEVNATKKTHTTPVRLDADRDECLCSEFVPVPVSAKNYHVLVELYRPGPRYAAPVVSDYTAWFSAAAPVSSG